MTATPARYITRDFESAETWEIRPQRLTEDDPYLQVDPSQAQWFAVYAQDHDGTWVHYRDCDTFAEAVRGIAHLAPGATVEYLGGLSQPRYFDADAFLWDYDEIVALPKGTEFFDGQGDLLRKTGEAGEADLTYVETDSVHGAPMGVDELVGTYSGETKLLPVVVSRTNY